MAALLTGVLALMTIVLHNSALLLTGQDPVTTPVSALSRNPFGNVQTLGLVLFALAHVALAVALPGAGRGWLWLGGRLMLVVSGALTLYVAIYFITAPQAVLDGADANDPLSLLASSTGLAMAMLWPGLKRISLPLFGFNAIWLVAWLLLVPLTLLVDAHWLGGYERLVGIVYVLWFMGMAIGLMLLGNARTRRAPAPTKRAAHD